MAACLTPITAYPYAESFESSTAGWTTGGSNNDWQWGTPAKTFINGAGAGNFCWITGGLSGAAYAPSARSWLQSPCFDFTGLARPEISFLIYWETEFQYDGGNLQYSRDGGSTWTTLGRVNEPGCVAENWYTNSSITNLSGLASPAAGWSGTILPTSGSCRGGNGSGGWVTARHCVPELAGEPQVVFRFTFGAGTTCNAFDGLAVDLFEVRELSPQPVSVSYSCVSSRTVLFTDADPDCHTSRVWDFGDGTVESNSAPGVYHTYPDAGPWTISLTSNHSCRGPETATVNITTLSAIATTTPETCVGGSDGEIELEIQPGTVSSLSIQWSPSASIGPVLSSLTTGDYIFTASALNACSLTDTVTVPLGDSAYVKPYLGDDGFVCPTRQRLLIPSGTYRNYLWQDGSRDASYSASAEGIYWVQVINSVGCVGRDSISLELNCADEPIFPTAFTPNGDDLNDVFRIFAGTTSITHWFIFDRWGQVLFQAPDEETVWSGDRVPEGVYTCVIEYTSSSGDSLRSVGRVTLVR